jgi:hypothetical protein
MVTPTSDCRKNLQRTKFKKKQNKDRGVEDFEQGERLPNSFRLKGEVK